MEQVEKKRSKALSGWLIFLPIANLYILAISITVLGVFAFGGIVAVLLIIVTTALNIVASRAAWKWRKWGVLILGEMAILAIVTSVVLRTHYYHYFVLVGVVGLVVLILLVHPIWQNFIWKGSVLTKSKEVAETPSIEGKRSVLISVWLVFLPIVSSAALIIPLMWIRNYYSIGWWLFDLKEGGLFFVCLIVISNSLFGLAAWYRKRWGIFGLVGIGITAAVTHSLSHHPVDFTPILIVAIIVLIILVYPVWKYFIWK